MTDLLTNYDPITLEEMSGIRLMNRTDTKFVTTVPELQRLLELARGDYRVQEIGGRRIAPYYTMYFDTPDDEMYRIHQAGHTNRQKLRIRSYVDSRLNFLEVKTKNNHGRTKKKRTEMLGFDPLHPDLLLRFGHPDAHSEEYDEFLSHHLRYRPETLSPKLENRFRRITLVNKQKTERLTIDTDLAFRNLITGQERALGGLAIIELKRDGLQPSPILELLNRLRIKPLGFSKYCMGMAMTNEGLPRNRFKPRLMTLRKLMGAPRNY